MAQVPWLTTTKFIDAVKKTMSFPIDQSTFSEQDLLDFANREMQVSQVPSMMEYHEEYLVWWDLVPLKNNTSRYSIPSRAIGMKLRDVFYIDTGGNEFEMTRINPDDKSHFSLTSVNNSSVYLYYLEGNEIVLVPNVQSLPTGHLKVSYFLRPNQIVADDECATITGFQTDVIIDNTTLVAGDTFSYAQYTFTAISGGSPVGFEFLIGATSVDTATNLVTAINLEGTGVTASNASGSSATMTLSFTDLSLATQIQFPYSYNIGGSVYSTSNEDAFDLPANLRLIFGVTVPTTFVQGNTIDLIETGGGHQCKQIDVVLQSVDGMTVEITIPDAPLSLRIGDYIALANECYIPQIPTDLHSTLVERTCERILQALGDQQGLAVTKAKIAEMEQHQGVLIDNRVDGSPQKVLPRHSLLRYNKFNYYRR